MNNRVFTYRLAGGSVLADNADVSNAVLDQFVAEEDLRLIGWRLGVALQFLYTGYTTADGAFYNLATLTFAASRTSKQGLIDEVGTRLSRLTFGSPASGFGWHDTQESRVAMLPSGLWITMKEGEIVNLLQEARNDLGLQVQFDGHAILYYTKG